MGGQDGSQAAVRVKVEERAPNTPVTLIEGSVAKLRKRRATNWGRQRRVPSNHLNPHTTKTAFRNYALISHKVGKKVAKSKRFKSRLWMD